MILRAKSVRIEAGNSMYMARKYKKCTNINKVFWKEYKKKLKSLNNSCILQMRVIIYR